MIERFLLLVLLGVLAAAVWLAWRFHQRRRLRRLGDRALPADLTGRLDRAQVNVLYFTADHCAQCRLQQAPILDQLRRTAPVAVHVIDAVAEASLVDHFGIMTVPTTVVLDRSQRPWAVNHGLASLPRLQTQLSEVSRAA